MASPFDIFDYQPFELMRTTSPTSGHFDAQDGWVAPDIGAGPVVIRGHLSAVTVMSRESALGYTPMGYMEKGDLRFFTETKLLEGDLLSKEMEDGVVHQYRVMELVRAHRLIAKLTGSSPRFEYNVREVPR